MGFVLFWGCGKGSFGRFSRWGIAAASGLGLSVKLKSLLTQQPCLFEVGEACIIAVLSWPRRVSDSATSLGKQYACGHSSSSICYWAEIDSFS